VFDINATAHIIQDCKSRPELLQLRNLYVQSDGCAEQYKSKYAKFEHTSYCTQFNLERLIWTHAPTAQFKCCCDSCGNDTKVWLRKEVRTKGQDLTNAWECFKHIDKHMPQPRQDTLSEQGESKQWKISARHHLFLCTPAQYAESQEIKDYDSAKIIVCQQPAEENKNNSKSILGIRSTYQFANFAADGDTRTIQIRQFPCFCSSCIKHDYDNCIKKHIVKPWKAKVLLKPTAAVVPVASIIPPIPVVESANISPPVNTVATSTSVTVADTPIATTPLVFSLRRC
jgi:hypothetical protein